MHPPKAPHLTWLQQGLILSGVGGIETKSHIAFNGLGFLEGQILKFLFPCPLCVLVKPNVNLLLDLGNVVTQRKKRILTQRPHQNGPVYSNERKKTGGITGLAGVG